ncbi:MAG TPA: ABC transporter permease, partial [Candidatus Dormibacteraeota bacterium]|nr:ABC transporter permease [Candidatus Dormibacteraeota bacterium]
MDRRAQPTTTEERAIMATSNALPAPKARRITRTDFLQFLLRGRAFIALILVVGYFATTLWPQFLSPNNIEIMSKHVAQNAVVAIGMTFVILTGGIDLSVGSLVGVTAMIAGLLINQGLIIPVLGVVVYPHTWMILVISIGFATVLGAVNGLVITRFSVAPFIATLGMMYMARGLAGLLNNGYTFANLVGRPELSNTGFANVGSGTALGINYSIWLMLVFGVVAWFVTTRTPFGRHVFAIGGNERSAELSGVRIKRTKLLVYM